MLIGLVFVLLSLFFGYLCYFFIHNAEAGEMVFSPTVNLPLAIVYLVTGIGIFLKKAWARILGIISLLVFAFYAGMYARFFLSITILYLFDLQRNTKIFFNSAPSNFETIGPYIVIDMTRDIIYPLVCIVCVVAALFLAYLLTRPRLKEQFK
jgi:hypothetical protein